MTIDEEIDELLEDETIDRPFAEEGSCSKCDARLAGKQVIHAGGLFADDYFCSISCLRDVINDYYIAQTPQEPDEPAAILDVEFDEYDRSEGIERDNDNCKI